MHHRNNLAGLPGENGALPQTHSWIYGTGPREGELGKEGEKGKVEEEE